MDQITLRLAEDVLASVEVEAEESDHLGPGYDEAWIQINPERIVSWGLDGDSGGHRTAGRYRSMGC